MLYVNGLIVRAERSILRAAKGFLQLFGKSVGVHFVLFYPLLPNLSIKLFTATKRCSGSVIPLRVWGAPRISALHERGRDARFEDLKTARL
jgi:hypothetical protein